MHKRTKATSIPKKVKDAVWKRDGGKCVICGSKMALQDASFNICIDSQTFKKEVIK